MGTCIWIQKKWLNDEKNILDEFYQGNDLLDFFNKDKSTTAACTYETPILRSEFNANLRDLKIKKLLR